MRKGRKRIGGSGRGWRSFGGLSRLSGRERRQGHKFRHGSTGVFGRSLFGFLAATPRCPLFLWRRFIRRLFGRRDKRHRSRGQAVIFRRARVCRGRLRGEVHVVFINLTSRLRYVVAIGEGVKIIVLAGVERSGRDGGRCLNVLRRGHQYAAAGGGVA